MNYNKYKIADFYNQSRFLPDKTMKLWLNKVKESAKDIDVKRILDLGCGTGRFTSSLSEAFNAPVVGIDPSIRMIKNAITCKNCYYILGFADSMPITDAAFDLIFLSMVYHHISNLDFFYENLQRVSAPGGIFIIRNSTSDLLDEVTYLKYFPSALEINKKRIPSKRGIIECTTEHGFSFVKHETIYQIFADSFKEYVNKISLRTLSDLSLISDEEFDSGIEMMYKDISSNYENCIREPIDLFTFKKLI